MELLGRDLGCLFLVSSRLCPCDFLFEILLYPFAEISRTWPVEHSVADNGNTLADVSKRCLLSYILWFPNGWNN